MLAMSDVGGNSGAIRPAGTVWVALAFWPAFVARHKGHSFLGYFILSLFFSRSPSSSPTPSRTAGR